MGLDLVLYTAKKWTDEGEELAYGRKTWAIADFFMYRCESVKPDYYIYEITEEAWHEFIDNVKPFFDYKFFREFIENYDEFDEDASYESEEVIERFLDEVLENDGPYSLGTAHEARAVLNWYDADDKVQACFDNDEPVWMLASF